MPCGIEGKGVTSLSNELNQLITIEDVIPKFLINFSDTFNCIFTNIAKEEADEILLKIAN